MNRKVLQAMVEAGAIKKVSIIGNGGLFHIEANTPNGAVTAHTDAGRVRTWVTLDAAAKWVRSLGLGSAQLKIANWQPRQKEIEI
jgi:L-asparaginase/Glu-tRNA(Gln) amidotransferase subunit D